MDIKKVLLLFSLCAGIYTLANGIEGEYQFAKFKQGYKSLNSHYDSQGVPNVKTSKRCTKGKNSYCWPVIQNEKGKVLVSYGRNDSVGIVSSARYKNQAYLYYSHSYKVGKKYYTDYYFIDQNGKKYDKPATASNSLSRKITKNRDVLDVTGNGIYLNNKIVLSSTEKLTHAKITNNLSGDQSVIAVTNEGKIYVSNTKVWKDTQLKVTKKGDRVGILSSFPSNENEIVYSIYKYINSYNKGLVAGRVNFDSNENIHGWLYNSENKNVGFDPEIYVFNNNILISAKNSSERTTLYTSIGNDSNFNKIVGIKPEHTKGFEDEKNFSFLAGTALSSITWDATNKIEDENANSFGNVEYEISNSLYKTVYLQGKIGDTQLAISHLKNESEAKGGQTAKASQYTSAMLDIDGYFSPQASLRIVSEQGEVNGVATVSNISGLLNGSDFSSNSFEVSTKFQRFSAFVMKERGFYHGLDYSIYKMPSLLGYGKDGSIKFTILDPELKIQKLTYNIGYDELSYARRYENNFSRIYLQGLAGVGIANLSLSGDLESRAQAKAISLGYNGTGTDTTLAIDYALDMGYIWQQKSKTLKGFGYSTQLGYKLRGTSYMSGSSSKSNSDSNKLTLEFDRDDIWHGPYVSVNIIF